MPLPNVSKTTPEEENLSLERRRTWLTNIKRSDLSNTQLATENSTQKICGNHFYKKQPAKLFEVNDSDLVPSLNLGHSEILFKSSISRCEKRKKRASERSSQEIADQKIMNDKIKRTNEATASTSDTPEQF